MKVGDSPGCIEKTSECTITGGLEADTLYRFWVISEVGSLKSEKSQYGLVSTLRDHNAMITKLGSSVKVNLPPLSSFVFARYNTVA